MTIIAPAGRPTLRYIGLGDSSGYAVAAAALVRALRAAGIGLVWEPLLPGGGLGLGYAPALSPEAGPQDLIGLRDDAAACEAAIIHFVPEYYPYFLARERRRGTRCVIGHTVWETDRLPRHWPALINTLDAVIVPTDWNRQVLRDSGVTIPIWVVPHLPRPAQSATDADRARLLSRLPPLAGRRVFYTVATWLERKSIGPLVAAFAEAFHAEDKVALVIKTTAHDLERVRRDPGHEGEAVPVRPQFEAMIGRAVLRHGRLPPPICLLTDDLPDGEIAALHELGDCYVSLCRAEGWGLGAFEAACAGRPVIITGWGGPTAYLAPETAYFVDWSLAPVVPGEANASYTPDQRWAEPDMASAVAALRAVAGDPAEAARRGARAARHIEESIVPAAVARDLLTRLADALAERPEAMPRAGGISRALSAARKASRKLLAARMPR
ncbi:glycosyltransferase [Ancylobacter sp. IITR112]|uniref:glycosyltransferase n=1 Tax=Ancylobacter sp. IITR112 TaxID=3138073 RepID=UPI00352B5338